MRARLLSALVVVAMATAPARARAEGETMTVVVRVGDGDDRALHGRVRGQSSDLPVTLVEARGRLEPTAKARRRAAAKLAAEHGARAVVWFERREPPARGLRVVVFDVEGGRLLERDLDGDLDGDGRSALLEAAAQVVRTALRSIELGEPIGEPAPKESDPEEPPPPVLEPSTPAGRRWYDPRVVVGGGTTLFGADAAVPGVSARLELRVWRRLDVGLSMEHFLRRAEVDAPQARVSLARATLFAGVAVEVVRAGPFELALGGRAGVVVIARRTESAELPAIPAPESQSLLAGFGPTAAIRLAPSRWLGVELFVAVDVVPAAPALVVRDSAGGNDVTIRNLWIIEPVFGVGLVFRP